MRHIFVIFNFTVAIGLSLSALSSSALPMSIKDDGSAIHLRALLKAKSTGELQATIKRKSTLDQARLTCSAQLRGKKIPGACFQVIALEKQSGLLTIEAEKEELLWLEPLCLERAKDSHDWRELAESSRNAALPELCLRAAVGRDRDLRYSAQSEHPEDLFERRFN